MSKALICDRCGNVFPKTTDTTDIRFEHMHYKIHAPWKIHLCDKCSVEFSKWLDWNGYEARKAEKAVDE